MGSLMLRLRGSAGRISAGIFRSQNLFCGNRMMMSTVRSANSADESLSSSTWPSKISPWLMLPPDFEGRDVVYKFYGVADSKVHCFDKRGHLRGGEEELVELPGDAYGALLVGSSHGWLVVFNQYECDLFLFNPLSRRHIKLPSIHTLPIPKSNLRGGFGCVSKVIISCSPDEEGCRALMSFGPENRLAVCCPGRTTEWTPIGGLSHEDNGGGGRKDARYYEDFVYSSKQKLFFCITKFNELEGWDVGDPWSPTRIDWFDKSVEETHPCHWTEGEAEVRQQKYLVFVEQSNQLFLVRRHIKARIGPNGRDVRDMYFGYYRGWDHSYPYKTVDFDVHRIDRDEEDGETKLRYMEGSLDGLVMFIGINHCFAISAVELTLNPNSIYFTDDKELTPPVWVNSTYGGHDIGIFNYENKTFSTCYYPCNVQRFKRIMPAPLWFTPSRHDF